MYSRKYIRDFSVARRLFICTGQGPAQRRTKRTWTATIHRKDTASPNMGRFNFHTTAEEAAAALSGSIKDKIILITGANMGGIGFETARAIALQHPARLILAGRSQSKLDDAEHAIHAEAPDVRTQQLILDLSSLASVRSAAQQIHDCTDLPRIDVLINNGGVMALPFTLTTDGYEAHFATNHLSHFLLTGLLRDKLLAAGPGARVVNVTSDSHQMGGVRFDDLTFEKGGDYHPMMAYAQSKTANMLHAVALTRRLAPSGGVAYSVHPGVIPTNLGRYVGFEGMVKMGNVFPLSGL